MDAWLVRTEKNRITGPFPGEKVRAMILNRELGFQDEICEANRYWIYLHEREEIQKALGIEVPASLSGLAPEEATQTDVEHDLHEPGMPESAEGTLSESTAMLSGRGFRSHDTDAAVAQSAAQTAGKIGLAPSLASSKDTQEGHSEAESVSGEAQQAGSGPGQELRRTGDFYEAQVKRSAEGTSWIQWLAVILLAGIIGGAILAIWLLKDGG